MSIEYRGGNSYRFRVKSEGIPYSTKFISSKIISEEDAKARKWPKDVEDAHKDYEVSIMRKEIGNNENMPFNGLCQMIHNDYNKTKLRASTIRDLDTPLFTSKTTGKPFSKEAVTARFRKLLKENNIPQIKFHDARHLNASLQIASGVDPVTVALALGDNVETILNNYTHGIEAIQKKSTEQFGNFLDEIKTN